MPSRRLTALVVTFGSCLLLFASLDSRKPAGDEPIRPREGSERVAAGLPGLLDDGFVQLPNQWRLRPAGKQIEVGNFPVNAAFIRAGSIWPFSTRAGRTTRSSSSI